MAFFIGGFLIDVDHYLWWIMEKRNFNIIRCYKKMKEESKKNIEKYRLIRERPIYVKDDMLHVFHVWEFWVLMFLLSFIHKLFFIIFLGMILHLSLDLIELFKDRIYGRRAISYFGWVRRH